MPEPGVMVVVGLLLMGGTGVLAYRESMGGRMWLAVVDLMAIIILAFGVGVNLAIWYVGRR